jgi:hypothetical protein
MGFIVGGLVFALVVVLLILRSARRRREARSRSPVTLHCIR